MPINPLYIYIETQKKDFIIKTAQNGCLFGFKDLSLEGNQLAIKDDHHTYNLTAHHISIYKNQDEQDQYHYTAYFVDEQKNKYQLHVYFDQKDQLTQLPVFSKLAKENDIYVRQSINEEMSQGLIHLAIENSAKPMKELHASHKKYLDNLNNEYLELEGQLEKLSQDISANKAEYQAKLIAISALLDKLNKMNPCKHYAGLVHLFARIHKLFDESSHTEVAAEELHVDEQAIEEVSEENPVLTETSSKEEQQTFKQHVVKNRSRFQARTLASSLQHAEDAQKRFVSSKMHSFDQQVEFFLDWERRVTNLYILSEDPHLHINLNDLQKIQRFLNETKSSGSDLLVRLLLSEQFEQAKKIFVFGKSVVDKLIRLALVTGKDRILDFLLTNYSVAINSFVVEDNVSPVLYCYLRHTDQTPKIACLSVLIKHKAFVFVRVPGEIASVPYLVMDKLLHPLRKAFIETSLMFEMWFKRKWLKEAKHLLTICEEADKLKIIRTVQTLEQSILNRNDGSKNSVLIQLEKHCELVIYEVISIIGINLVRQILNDVEYMNKMYRYQQDRVLVQSVEPPKIKVENLQEKIANSEMLLKWLKEQKSPVTFDELRSVAKISLDYFYDILHQANEMSSQGVTLWGGLTSKGKRFTSRDKKNLRKDLSIVKKFLKEAPEKPSIGRFNQQKVDALGKIIFGVFYDFALTPYAGLTVPQTATSFKMKK